MKKILSIMLCLSLVLAAFCSCSEKETENETEAVAQTDITQDVAVDEAAAPGSVSLGYYSHHSLNPFKTQSTANRCLCTLIYDSLFRLDKSYLPVAVIAESYDIDELTVTVGIKSNIYFSDGSELSPADVIYSFMQAQKSSSYSARLSNILSVVSEGNSIVFRLSTPDIFILNCLDFPIVRSSTGEDELPIGSGRYVPKKTDDQFVLEANESYSLNEEMEQKQIKLVDINESENIMYLLQIGDLTAVYDDFSKSEDIYNISATSCRIPLNNLLFLSFNCNCEALGDINIKKAIESAIDKTSLCSIAYDSLARSCKTVFNPDWDAVSAYAQCDTCADTAEARRLLEESGYIYAYESNEYRSKNFEFLKLSMIVSSGSQRKVTLAKEIAKSLRLIGIDVSLDILEFEKYTERLKSGKFDMYIGEVKLSANMDLSEFFSSSGSANYEINTKSTVRDAYYDFKSGKIDITTFINVFDEYLPFIPICYRSGMMYYSKCLQYEGSVNESDIFANIYSWSFYG